MQPQEERFYMKSMYWLVVVVLAVLYVKYYYVIGPRILLMLAGFYAVRFLLTLPLIGLNTLVIVYKLVAG